MNRLPGDDDRVKVPFGGCADGADHRKHQAVLTLAVIHLVCTTFAAAPATEASRTQSMTGRGE